MADAASRRRAVRIAIVAGVVGCAMVGAAFAFVPLYRAFCQATGFGGTTQVASRNTSVVLDKTVKVRFDTNVRNDLPWSFKPEVTSIDVKIGATGMAFFKVKNLSDHAIKARATYNVVPQAAGIYFRKLECFCFSDQTLKAGETAEFPMIFFVDPGYAKDNDTKGEGEITLSYSFFPTPDQPGAAAPVKTAEKAKAPLGEPARAGL